MRSSSASTPSPVRAESAAPSNRSTSAPRAGEAVEERRLARVGVAHESDHGHARGLAAVALQPPVHPHASQLAADLLDPVTDHAAVGLELGLAGPTGADAAAKPFQMLPLPHESRQE